MLRPLALVAAITCLSQGITVAEEPLSPVSVVVADTATASSLTPLARGVRYSVLVRNEGEAEEVVRSRAFKLRFATHFVYRSGHETPISAIYRERLQNHGAIAIDLRALSPSQLDALLKLRGPLRLEPSDGLSLAKLAWER